MCELKIRDIFFCLKVALMQNNYIYEKKKGERIKNG